MRNQFVSLSIGVLLMAAKLLAQAQPPRPPAKLDADECAVWQREVTFAQSVEKHDIKAFAAHLHSGTVFSAATQTPIRGRDAVVKEWTPIVEGREIRLRWRPDVVNIGGDRAIAISRGPYLSEDLRSDAKTKYRVGQFTSVWVKQPSGEWVVLFDGAGSPGPEVKDAQGAEEYFSRAPAACPAR